MSNISWDDYFMKLAIVVSERSPDPNTKHGCVIVDKEKKIISTGYNGPISNIDDSTIDWSRPAKYRWVIHAEENAVLFAKQNLRDCTAYVTGQPCVYCFRRFCQVGMKRVVCGDVQSQCLDEDDVKFNRHLASMCNVILESHSSRETCKLHME